MILERKAHIKYHHMFSTPGLNKENLLLADEYAKLIKKYLDGGEFIILFGLFMIRGLDFLLAGLKGDVSDVYLKKTRYFSIVKGIEKGLRAEMTPQWIIF
ncbi:hypothetical protein RUND412_004364 [Rhizina undulata]